MARTLIGPLAGEAVEVFGRQGLVLTLRPGQLVILDHLSVHQRAAGRRLIEDRSCQRVFLPASSPAFLIDPVFAKLSAAARTQDALAVAVTAALVTSTMQAVRNSFRHCGSSLLAQPL